MDTEGKTQVVILMAHYRIVGFVTLLPGARVTDFLTESEEFIAVTDAEVWTLNGHRLFATDFLNINRSAVELVIPGNVISYGLGAGAAVELRRSPADD